MALSGLPELPEGMYWRVGTVAWDVPVVQLREKRRWFGSKVLHELLFEPDELTIQEAAELCLLNYQQKLARRELMKIVGLGWRDHGR